jgi:phosphoribosylaminoimidazolecarboxamide formyltransferase/IMP cyclohydrolase
MYKISMTDNFPPEMTITFGSQRLKYGKRTWKLADAATGDLIEKGSGTVRTRTSSPPCISWSW